MRNSPTRSRPAVERPTPSPSASAGSVDDSATRFTPTRPTGTAPADRDAARSAAPLPSGIPPIAASVAVSARSVALDVARGLAIIGIVFNHSVDGLVSAGMISPDEPLFAVNQALYIMRVPALVFLVGLFIPRGVAKRGSVPYVRGRVALLIYLYVVWQVVQGIVETITSPVRNGDTGVLDILMFWKPLAHLWFLPFLAVATAVVVVAMLWRSTASRIVLAVALLVFAVLTWGWSLEWAGLRGVSLISFVAAGAAIGLDRLSRLLARSAVVWTAVGSIALGGFLLLLLVRLEPATVPGDGDVIVRIASMVGAALGIVVLLAVARLVASVPRLNTALAAVGRVTLPIYLAHVIVVAGMRVLFEAVGFDSSLMLIVLIPAGVLLPLVLFRFSRALRLRWLFELPRPLAALVGTGTAKALTKAR